LGVVIETSSTAGSATSTRQSVVARAKPKRRWAASAGLARDVGHHLEPGPERRLEGVADRDERLGMAGAHVARADDPAADGPGHVLKPCRRARPRGLQLLAAGHQVLQLLEIDLVLVEGAERLAAIEDGEAVAHGVRVADIVGDEDDAEALLLHLEDVFQHHRGLPHAQGRGRLVEDQHLGPEIDGAGDRHALPLAARERAHGLLRVAHVDADARISSLATWSASSKSKKRNGHMTPWSARGP
jgi:hypothetical protein